MEATLLSHIVHGRKEITGISFACGVIFYLILACVQPARAQVTASISGRITDKSGAVISGSNVTVTNLDTGQARTATTDAAGDYRVLSLPVGRYDVKAEREGFQATIQSGITLAVGQEAVVNLQLEVGAVQQQVTVMGEAPLVNTTTSSTAGLVAEKEVKDLPLNGRSFDQLLALNVGTGNFSSAQTAGGTTRHAYSIAGRRPDETLYTINGVEYPGNVSAGSSALPGSVSGDLLGVDAVREFNVVQNAYGAEYGKSSGGQITIVTSSGTNSLHGNVFEFLRNSDLDARNFFDFPPGQRIPEFRRNQFGGALGGPIKKDKIFVFGNYEGLRQRLGVSDVAIMPDAQMRQGLLPTGPGGTYIQPAGEQPYMVSLLNAFYPSPNGQEIPTAAGAASGLAYNFSSPISSIQQDFGQGRFDYYISEKDSLAVTGLYDTGNSYTPSADPYFAGTVSATSVVDSIQETHIFSPTVLNVATLGFGRSTETTATNPTVSIPSNLLFIPATSVPGTIAISGGPSATASSVTGAGGALPNPSVKNLFSWADDLHITRGSHSLSFGVWVQRAQENSFGPSANTTGGASFSTLTAFLTDQLNTFLYVPSLTKLGFRTTMMAWYVQDEIKLRPNLTLRLGLRDESTTGDNEAHGRACNYVYGAGGIINQNTLCGPSALTQNNAIALWQPRVGLAWDPTGSGKWSVRAGFGIMNDLQNNLAFRVNGNYPYGGRITLTNPDGLLGLVPLGYGPAFELQPCGPGIPSSSCAIYAPEGVEPNMHTPTVQEWSLTVEREVAHNLVLRLGYVGSQAYHLINYYDTNTIPPQVCANPAGCKSGGTKVTTAAQLAAAPTVPQGTTYEPPGTAPNPYTSYTQTFMYNGVSSYHAVNASLEKRVSQGLGFKVNYTFGKLLDQDSVSVTQQSTNEPGDVLTPYNLGLSKGKAAYNLQQQFNFNYTYVLPFGHGQRFGSGAGTLANYLIGGWQWNGIFSAQSGFPITPTAGQNISGTGDSNNPDRPNWNPAFTGPVVTGNPHQWYNPAAFLLPTAGTFGNVPRGAFPGPDLINVDTSLFKEIPVHESMHMQFRMEVFNILNRANFGIPSIPVFSGSGVSPSAGSVTTTATTSRQIQFALKLIF